MQVYNRIKKRLINSQEYGSGSLKFLYHTVFGRLILRILVSRSVSRLTGLYYSSRLSRNKIYKFVKQYNININSKNLDKFNSFNDFFVREPDLIDRPIQKNKEVLGSVADAKLLVKKINQDLRINIKNTVFTVESLLGDVDIAQRFKGGDCLIYRLTMDDSHHYFFPDNGRLIKSYKIPGKLHSVQPITGRQCTVFSENSREVSILSTDNFGVLAYVEIGALFAGKIMNLGIKDFLRGDKKGNFCLGGSAIILLFEKDRLVIDKDIVEYSSRGFETFVKINEGIGLKKC